MSKRRTIAVICAASLLAGVVFATERLYYFPLTPLSLDVNVETQLPGPAEGHLRLLFVGDTLLGDWARSAIVLRGHDFMFGGTAPLVQSADLAIANLEGPISLFGQAARKHWAYQMVPEAAAALARAGFDLVTLANNHIRDRGDFGIWETRLYLEAAKIKAFGAGKDLAEAHAPAIVARRGLRVAFLGYMAPRMLLSGKPANLGYLGATARRGGAAMAEPARFSIDIAAAKKRADLVIVSLHLGDRYQRSPTDFERKLCHALVEAGADAVVGHGTHILGPIERHRGRPILYSLGNYAFGSANARARFSLIAALDVDPRQRRVVELHALPLYTMNKNPWVDFQSKVLIGNQAEVVVRELVARSSALGETALRLATRPTRASMLVATPRIPH